MTIPADLDLPGDVDALKAMVMAMSAKAARADVLEDEVADLKARNADADEQIAKLKLILKAFNRYRYGRRSEKQGTSIETDLDEQGAFVFEEIDTGSRDRSTGCQGSQSSRYKACAAST